jgi:hypothetical protein
MATDSVDRIRLVHIRKGLHVERTCDLITRRNNIAVLTVTTWTGQNGMHQLIQKKSRLLGKTSQEKINVLSK